jgi:amidohydrolase
MENLCRRFFLLWNKKPGFLFYIGGMPKGNGPIKAPPHHTTDFYFDDSGIKTGIKAFCDVVIHYMNMK